MKISRNKLLSAIAIILLVSMIAASSQLQPIIVKAVTTGTDANGNTVIVQTVVQTYNFVTASPDPIGVGQRMGIVPWLDQNVGAYGNDVRFHNYSIQIFGPDGNMIPGVDAFATQNNCTVDIPLIYDPTASGFTFFTPTVIGHYTIIFNHKTETMGTGGAFSSGHYIPQNGDTNTTFLGNTCTIGFNVQQTPIPAARDSFPLPNEYWSRPIENQNVYWYALSSNWLNDVKDRNYEGQLNNRFQADGIAPNTPHIMWGAPVTNTVDAFTFGGQFPGSSFYSNPPFSNQIIMNGNLMYAVPNATNALSGEYKVVDLRTGQIKMDYFGASAPQWGMYYDADNVNQHGVTPSDGYLFMDNGTQPTYNTNANAVGFLNGTQWIGMRPGNPAEPLGDGGFGTQYLTLNDVPTWGAAAQGITGEILYGFVFNNGANQSNPTGNDWQLRIWNCTLASVTETGSGTVNASGTTQTSRLTNISDTTGGPAVPVTSLGGTQLVLDPSTVSVSLQLTEQNYTYYPFEDYYLLCRNGTLPTAGSNATTPGSPAYSYFAIACSDETINGVAYKPGQLMWIKTFNAPSDGSSVIAGPSADGVFTTVDKETGVISAFDMTTGASLWTSTALGSATAYPYTQGTTATGCTAAIAYNTLYTAGSSGQVYAYDLQTGTLKWGYILPLTGVQGVSAYPTNIGLIADGKIYLGSYTLTSASSLYSGASVTCLNAWDGTKLWTLPSWGGAGGFAVSDGYMTYLDYYTLNVFSIGRGPSSTTVDSTVGDMKQATITGTVTDASPGSAIKGSGAIADKDMSAWMAYMFMNAAKPANASGVDVTITVIDPNNNLQTVGTVAANTDGTYSINYTPAIPGTYQVIATFAGTNGYYPSFAHSTMYVNEAAQPTATPTATPVSMTQTYVLGSTAAIIIALAIAAVVLALVLRKRP